MISKIKKYLAVLAASAALAVPALVPVAVSAQEQNADIQGSVCTGVELNFDVDGGGDCAQAEGSEGALSDIIRLVINVISVVVGVVAVVMIIWGGLKYITSGGDSSNVSSAKNTIIYAIIGLVIVALAQFIVRFVLGKTVGVADGAA
jgi:uncharacterized membrane protein